MEEQSHSLVRRTRFSHTVYHRDLGASRLEYSIPFTLQPRRTLDSNPCSADSATVDSRTRTTHVTQTQQTVSPISEPKDPEEAGSIQKRGLDTPHSQRKQHKKGYFGKLLHITTSSSSDSKSLNNVSTFLKHVKSLILHKTKSPSTSQAHQDLRKCSDGFS